MILKGGHKTALFEGDAFSILLCSRGGRFDGIGAVGSVAWSSARRA